MENYILNEKELLQAKEYLNWLKYEPINWNINNNKENIYNIRKKELILIPVIEDSIKSNGIYNANIVLDIMNSMSIFTLANLKLNKEELKYCDSKLHNMIYNNKDLDITPKEKLESIINSLNPTISLYDSYIKCLLETRIKNIDKTYYSNNESKKNILKKEINGYY